jgi:hypothetical protein
MSNTIFSLGARPNTNQHLPPERPGRCYYICAPDASATLYVDGGAICCGGGHLKAYSAARWRGWISEIRARSHDDGVKDGMLAADSSEHEVAPLCWTGRRRN